MGAQTMLWASDATWMKDLHWTWVKDLHRSWSPVDDRDYSKTMLMRC